MNERIPNRSTFFMRKDQYDACSRHKRRHHHVPKCRIRGCEAPAVLDGFCPFHYDLVAKKEMRVSLKHIMYLLNTISHQLPLASFQIISPAEIPTNCSFFNNEEHPDIDSKPRPPHHRPKPNPTPTPDPDPIPNPDEGDVELNPNLKNDEMVELDLEIDGTEDNPVVGPDLPTEDEEKPTGSEDPIDKNDKKPPRKHHHHHKQYPPFSDFNEFMFNPQFNHSFSNNYSFPTVIPPCQNYLRYNKSPICIGEACQFYKIEEDEDLNE